MTLHPRLSLHQVAMIDESVTAFADHCRAVGVGAMTLATPSLTAGQGFAEAQQALADGALRVECVNHPFALYPDLDRDSGQAAAELADAIAMASALGARSIYMLSGARGSLDWEAAATRFAELLAPGRAVAAKAGVELLVENANAFNADLHIAHTLPDAALLAETAGIGLCLDLHACWMEAGIERLIRRALPLTGLIQVSDYVLGDRSAPCRAVPGDGAIPLEALIGMTLDAGYNGTFDLELVGPRIQAEGARAATARAAEWLAERLTRWGV